MSEQSGQARKVKVQIELNLGGDVLENKKSFYRYCNDKRKTRGKMGPLLKEIVDLVTQDKKAEILNLLSCLSFNQQEL